MILIIPMAFFPFITLSEGSTRIFSSDAPDTIFFNGTIITMEEYIPFVEAIAIKGNLITAIGNESEIISLGDSHTCYIDLQGKTMVPGFIDAHAHWIGDRGLANQSEVEEVMETLVSNGWTSISELFVNQDRLNELQALDTADLLRVRVNAYLPLSYGFDRFGDWYQAYQPGYEYSNKLRIAGVKIFADGWIFNPVLYFNQSELEGLFQEAHNRGFQIAVHSVVANATDVVLNAFENVLGNDSNTLRHRMEHLLLLRDDQIARLAALGILGCIQFPWANSDWIGNDFGDTTGLMARWRELLDAGVHVMGSTDHPYTFIGLKSPLEAISTVVTRVGFEGQPPLDYMLNQTITAEEALRLLTVDAAYGTFQEDVKGSIKEGKFADLVILSDNPLAIPEQDIINVTILMTVIGGEKEYQAGDFTPECVNLTSTSTQTSPTTFPISIPAPAFTAFLAIIVFYHYRKKRRQ
ncbi:MAG: amidohydrolase [Candidatus Odinarchaeota archaeon]